MREERNQREDGLGDDAISCLKLSGIMLLLCILFIFLARRSVLTDLIEANNKDGPFDFFKRRVPQLNDNLDSYKTYDY